jgi:hypothetical protein
MKEIDFSTTITRSSDRYYKYVVEDESGLYGSDALISSTANYWNEGDVGNEIWVNARRLPFGDECDSRFIITQDSVIFLGFEDHAFARQEPHEKPEDHWEENDPAYLWAVHQLTDIMNMGADVDEETWRKKESLLSFINEVKQFHTRQVEETTMTVPGWAMDSILYAMEEFRSPDTEVIEFIDRVPVALKPKVISRTPVMARDEVERYHNIETPFVVHHANEREWCIALVEGKKKYGPYGSVLGATTFLKPANRDNMTEVASHREKVLRELLRDHGFRCEDTVDEDGNAIFSYEFIFTDENRDNIQVLETTYSHLAGEISRIASLKQTVDLYVASVRDEVYREKFYKGLKKRHITDKAKEKFELQQNLTYEGFLIHIAQQEYEVTHISQCPVEWCVDVLNFLPGNIGTRYNTRINEATDKVCYLLRVNKQYGHEVVTVTYDKTLADLWMKAGSDDLPYFLASSAEREETDMPSSYLQGFEEMSDDARNEANDLYEESMKYWWWEGRPNHKVAMSYIPMFNAGRSVEWVVPRHQQESRFLNAQVPLNLRQLGIAKEALAALGRYIVSLRMKNKVYKDLFSKSQHMLRWMLVNYDRYEKALTPSVLRCIADGTVDLHMGSKTLQWPSQPAVARIYLDANLVNVDEFNRQNTITVPVLSFNMTCNDHVSVFGIVQNFHPNNENRQLAQQIISYIES